MKIIKVRLAKKFIECDFWKEIQVITDQIKITSPMTKEQKILFWYYTYDLHIKLLQTELKITIEECRNMIESVCKKEFQCSINNLIRLVY